MHDMQAHIFLAHPVAMHCISNIATIPQILSYSTELFQVADSSSDLQDQRKQYMDIVIPAVLNSLVDQVLNLQQHVI